MTNSRPKSSKIERQGSPNSQQSGKRFGQRSPNYIKTVTFFNDSVASPINNNASAGKIISNNNPVALATPNNNTGKPGKNGNATNASGAAAAARNSRALTNRQNCNSPNTPARNIPRSSPMRQNSPRGSPTNNNYAGAKFSEPPLPTNLPKPPTHWTGSMFGGCRNMQPCHLTQHLEMLVQA